MSPRRAANAGTRKELTAEQRARRARRLANRKADSMPTVGKLDGPVKKRKVKAPLASPVPEGGIIGVVREPYLLRLLVRRELAKLYSASLLGLFWSYIQPAIRFAVYYLVFGVLLNAHASVPYYAVHLFCGIVFTHYFAEVFSQGTRSIWHNRQLVVKMPLPPEVFPVSQMVVGFYQGIPQLILLTFVTLLSGIRPDITGVLALVLAIAIIVTFACAMALLFSAINVYYRDFEGIVGTITQFMHFVVPMMYTYSRVAQYQDSHPVFYQVYMANPVANAVILAQRFFWQGVLNANPSQVTDPALRHEVAANEQWPPHLLERGLIVLLCCLVFLGICQMIFSRLDSKFPERL